MTGVLNDDKDNSDKATDEKKDKIDNEKSESKDIDETKLDEPNGEIMKCSETMLGGREDDNIENKNRAENNELEKNSSDGKIPITPEENSNERDGNNVESHQKTVKGENQENDVITSDDSPKDKEADKSMDVPERGVNDDENVDGKNLLESKSKGDHVSDNSSSSSSEQGLSEYELLRLRKIKRNQERMKQLGLFNLSQKITQTKNELTPTPRKVKKPTVQAAPTPRTLPRRKARDFVYSPYIDDEQPSSSNTNKRGTPTDTLISSTKSELPDTETHLTLAPSRNRKMYTIPKSTKIKSKILSKNKKRRKRCLQCAGCIALDCGKCNNCLDKKKFGGPDKLRQACRFKRCESWFNPEPVIAGDVGLGVYEEVLEFLWGEGRITDDLNFNLARNNTKDNSKDIPDTQKHLSSIDQKEKDKMIPELADAAQTLDPTGAQTQSQIQTQKESSSQCIVVPNTERSSPSIMLDNINPEIEYAGSDDGNMEYCQVCKQTGVLICCDKCPRSFHPLCIGMAKEHLPSDHWECRFCQDDPIAKQNEHVLGERSFGIVNWAFSSVSKVDHADLIYSKMLTVSKIHELIQYLKHYDFGYIFSKPVVNVPGYRKVIKQPMDLETIEKKIVNGIYYRNAIRVIEKKNGIDGININEINTRETKELFGVIDLVILEILKNIETIWHNCFLFNPVESVYYKMGQVQRRKYIAILTSSIYTNLDIYVIEKLTEFVSECRIFETEELEREKELDRLENERDAMKLDKLSCPTEETKRNLTPKKRKYKKTKLSMPRKRHIQKEKTHSDSGKDGKNSRKEEYSDITCVSQNSSNSNNVEHIDKKKKGIVSNGFSNFEGELSKYKRKKDLVNTSLLGKNSEQKKIRKKKRKRKKSDAIDGETSTVDHSLKAKKQKKRKKKQKSQEISKDCLLESIGGEKLTESKSQVEKNTNKSNPIIMDVENQTVQRKISRKELVQKVKRKRGRPRKNPEKYILGDDKPKPREQARKVQDKNGPNNTNNDTTETKNETSMETFVLNKEKFVIQVLSRKQILKTFTPNHLKLKKGSKVVDVVLANINMVNPTKKPRTIILNKEALMCEPKKIRPIGNELGDTYQFLKKKLDASNRSNRKQMLEGCIKNLIIPSSAY